MPIFTTSQLKKIAADIFICAGASAKEAGIVADALVLANLAGHDSHGVLRIPEYVAWIEKKEIILDAHLKVLSETDSFARVDGGWGFGQVVGREAMQVAIEKASRVGVAAVSACHCAHLGRIGDYPLMAAERGMAAIMFVNTHGGGKLVAPWGGRDRRLSANPISISVPRRSSEPLLLDISTSAIAEGKVRSMFNRKAPVPPGCIIDAKGNPTTDAADFYGSPPGALLPFGAHKGFALGMMTDILAGALSGGGCSRQGVDRVGNTFFTVVIDIKNVTDSNMFYNEVDQLVGYIKNCPRASGFDEILIPGEPEIRERTRREQNGIPVDEQTWLQITAVAMRYRMKPFSID